MIFRVTLALSVLIAAVWGFPAQAKKRPPEDPGATICELEWKASFGEVKVKQTYSGHGDLTDEDIDIERRIVASGNWGGKLSLSAYRHGSGSQMWGNSLYYLGLSGPMKGGKDFRLVVDLPGRGPLTVAMEYGGLTIPVTEEQLGLMLASKQRLNYRMIRVDRKGQEKAMVEQGWFDLTSLQAEPLGGLSALAERSRTLLTQARSGTDAPCVNALNAEMNSTASDQAVRKWISFSCAKSWSGPLGEFTLGETSFKWLPRPRDGVALSLSGDLHNAPSPGQPFLTPGFDPNRYGQITLSFDKTEWGQNYRSSEPALREQQMAELRRGNVAMGRWLSQQGEVWFTWYDFVRFGDGQGDLQIQATDKRSGATAQTALRWSELLDAEQELRREWLQLEEREKDPLKQCKPVVDAEFGGEDLIVT